jgi:hypothetical protein
VTGIKKEEAFLIKITPYLCKDWDITTALFWLLMALLHTVTGRNSPAVTTEHIRRK